MISLWALLDSNQRASDYESRAGSLQGNDLALTTGKSVSHGVAHCRTLSRPMVTGMVTAPRVKRRRFFCWRCTRRFTVRGVAKYCPPCRKALRKPNSYSPAPRKWPASFLTVQGAA